MSRRSRSDNPAYLLRLISEGADTWSSICDHLGLGSPAGTKARGGDPDGGRKGWGATLCPRHQIMVGDGEPPMCERCFNGEKPFEPKG